MQKRLLKQFSKLLMLVALLFGVNSFGQTTNIIPTRTDVSGFSSWIDTNVAGTSYVQLLTASSSTVTPSMNFDLYTTKTLNFDARTFGGVTAAENIITVSISVNNGTSYTVLGTRTPTSSTMTTQAPFDITSYAGTTVKIKFTVAGTSNTVGAGIDDIAITGVESPTGPAVTSSAASSVTATTATLNGSINANGTGATAASFQYGTTTSYGSTITASPNSVTGSGVTNITAALSGLTPNTTYYFRSVGTQSTATNGGQLSFLTPANVPGTPTVDGATTTSLNVTIAANGNPAGTEYAIQVGSQYVQANGSLNTTAVWQTATAWGTKTISGLASSTQYTVGVKARNSALAETGFATANGITLANTAPSITTGGTIAALSTTYGTASGISNFTVSSLNLTDPVTVTAPTGFEVSLSNAAGATYTQTVSVTANSTNTPVYIRLSANAQATTYNGSAVTLSSTGATTITKAIANSTVSAKALTLSGLTGGTKEYDRTTTAPVTGVAVLSATANGDVITLTGTPAFNFTNPNAGTSKPITITGYTLSGANASNYTLTLPSLTGSVTAKPVTIDNAAAQNKPYDGNQDAVVSGTVNGRIAPDDVTVATIGQFAQATVGETITVTGFTLTGTQAGNYSLTQQPAVTANITKAENTLSAAAINLGSNATYALPGATVSTNSNGVLTYSLTASPAVTLNAGNLTTSATLTGTATLTITQAETANYLGKTISVTVNVTAISYDNNDYRTTSSGTWITAISGTPVATWERYVNGVWSASSAPLASTSNSLHIQANHTITAGLFANSVKLKIRGSFIQNASSSTSASINVYDGGTITINGSGFVNSGEFTVESNGTVIVNNAGIDGTSNVWNGTENFKSGSNFIVQNWDYGNRIITSTHKFQANSDGYYFGNLNITTPTVNFAIVNGNLTANLTENNLIIAGAITPTISLTNNSANVTIGGNLIVNSGLFILGSNGSPAITINGNIALNTGTINFSQTSSSNTAVRVELKGNLSTGTGTSFTSGDPDSKLVFRGNTIQTVSLATLGSNVAFEIASGAELQLIDRDLAIGTSNPFTVLTGGTLAFNNLNLAGAGAFTLQAGGTLKITDAAGVTTSGANGNVQTTGTRTYTNGGNFTYVGATQQAFGNAVTNAGVITIDKTNATDVVTASAVPTIGSIVVNKGVLIAGTNVLGGAATNLTIAANGKYITAGDGIKPDANGTYTIDPAATVEFTGTNATNIRVTPTYGKVIVSGTNVGTSSTTEGLKFSTGGSFEVTNGSTFNVANASGFNGGTTTAITTTGTPAITLGETSTVVYNGTTAQTVTAFNTTDGSANEGYGNLTVKNTSPATLGANLVYARNNVTIDDTATFTVASGKTLKVKNQLIKNGGTFSIENNGALLQTNDVDNTGSITVTKNSNPLYYLDYTLWSSPVSGTQTLANFSPSTISTRFYEYGISNGAGYYLNIPDGNVPFTPAKGYLIRMPDVVPELPNYYHGDAYTFVGHFNGVPNNGEVTLPANIQANRYTATGNPYPSPINISDFFTANNQVVDAGSGIYLWRKKNGANTSAYATITLAGATLSYNPRASSTSANNAQFFTGNSSQWVLSQGQGFFVRTKPGLTGTPVITFNNAMRRPAPISGEQAFFRTAQSTTSRLWLNIANAQGDYGQSAIAYIDGATTGLDYGYDGKMFSGANELSIYSLAESTKLAIQARPLFSTADVVPMGYIATAAGTHTIALDHTDGVFNNDQNVYLRDNVLGLVHNVTEGAYTFTTEAGTFNERFDVLYTADALGTTTPQLDANAVIIYKEGNTLNINAGTAVINDVTVFDIRGRKLVSKTGVNAVQTVLTNLDAAQQVLIIEVNTSKGKVSKKIVY